MGFNERYDAYMLSPEWRTLRAAVFKRDNNQCRQCGSRDRLTAHHLTYVRMFRERMEDLITLCKDCHEMQHRKTNTPQPCIPRKIKMGRDFRARKNLKKQRDHKAEQRRQRREENMP